MTIQEFSTEFDVLYNNITSNQAPGLNEYEKSVFLTKAEFQLVNEYFNNRTDGIGGGFDGSQKRQYDFSSLIRTANLFEINTFKTRITTTEKLDRRSKVFLFPQDYFLAVNEILSDENWQYSVLPLNYSEYQRLMLKPYNFPVKRGAWRIMTDKKNCNWVQEYVKDSDGKDTESDYWILSTWADQKRNLEISIRYDTDWTSTYASETFTVSGDVMSFPVKVAECGGYARVVADCSWSADKLTYEVDLLVFSNQAEDDKDILDILREGFSYLKDYAGYSTQDSDLIKAATHLDGLAQSDAPSKFTEFQTTEEDVLIGKTFVTKVIKSPIAEIIGKFSNIPNYQLRYIRTLTPIILDDLENYGTDLTIGGVTQQTECILPEETHQEILERAVTLAKIAWQGGTATQAAQRDN